MLMLQQGKQRSDLFNSFNSNHEKSTCSFKMIVIRVMKEARTSI